MFTDSKTTQEIPYGNPVNTTPVSAEPFPILYRIYEEKTDRIIGELDKQGYLTEYQYNDSHQLIKTIHYCTRVLTIPAACPNNLDEIRPESSLGDQITTRTYNAMGDLIESRVLDLSEPTGELDDVTSVNDDTYGRSTAPFSDESDYDDQPLSSPRDTITVNTYNASGELIGSDDAGEATDFDYNQFASFPLSSSYNRLGMLGNNSRVSDNTSVVNTNTQPSTSSSSAASTPKHG